MKIPVLHVEQVMKSFGTKQNRINAVDCVSFEVSSGDFCVLVGRSGSGKTTLLNLAGLIDRPTSGDIRFEGVATSNLSDQAKSAIRLRNISFVFQDFGLLPFLKVWENIAYKLLLQGQNRITIRRRVEEVAALFGIQDKLNMFPPQLSGGQQQRVSIARAIASDTKLLIADEPTANLDEENSLNVIQLLKMTQEKNSLAILIATHDPMVKSFGSQLLQMHDGRVERMEVGA